MLSVCMSPSAGQGRDVDVFCIYTTYIPMESEALPYYCYILNMSMRLWQYNVCHTMCAIQSCVSYNVFNTMCIIQCVQYNMFHAMCSIQCVPYNVCNTMCTTQHIQCIVEDGDLHTSNRTIQQVQYGILTCCMVRHIFLPTLWIQKFSTANNNIMFILVG